MSSKDERTFNGQNPPEGEKVRFENGKPVVPVRPIIPFIEGDGIGRDVWRATRKVLDAAVKQAYGDARRIAWMEVFAGQKAKDSFGEWLPEDTVAALREYGIAIKGPLATPTGGGYRSINVRLRQTLDLYTCVRPVKYFTGVPSVVLHPEKLDVVIFRENTEDVYAGIEYEAGSAQAGQLGDVLEQMGNTVRDDAGIGIKIISRTGSRRLIRRAIQYAIDHKRTKVTLVHKGNIQKFTEGAFRNWGYELVREEFADVAITEEDLWSKFDGKMPEGKILVNEKIADAIFHEVLTNPQDFSVIATTNLNGDYLSDACAAQVGGLGMAPGANIGEGIALFEATHGTAASLADKDLANPGSLLLSGVLMLEFLGWNEAAKLVRDAFATCITTKKVTGDLARLMPGATALKTSEFADALVANVSPKVEAPKNDVINVNTAPKRRRRKSSPKNPVAVTPLKKRMPKVSIVGAGNVGATAAQYISQKGLADVVLVDIVEGMSKGKGLDLLQAGAILGDVAAPIVGTSDYAQTADSDIVVITAGVPRKPGMSRDDLIITNAKIVKDVCLNTIKWSPNAIYVIVTNPLDVMAYLAHKTLGLPENRVIGMAGVLDSARFQTFIAQELNVAPADVRAMVLGGHGDLMVPLPRYSTVNGVPMTELMTQQRIDALCARTRDGGAEIVSLLKTGSAYYAPGASVAHMVQAILHNEHRLLPCSVSPDGAYGLKDVYIGLPVILGNHGVENIVELKLKRAEKRALRDSANSVSAGIDVIAHLLP